MEIDMSDTEQTLMILANNDLKHSSAIQSLCRSIERITDVIMKQNNEIAALKLEVRNLKAKQNEHTN